MKYKSVISTLMVFVTIALSYYIKSITRLYRMFIVIDESTPQSTIDTLNTIIKHQNILWILLGILIVGIVFLLVVEFQSIKRYLKNMY